MAHEIFKAISNLRMALDTETDRDSPDNETTYGAIRSRVEYLMQILLGTGFDGTVTGIATTTITHAEGAQGIDEHNSRTTIITSGIAKGFFYTIDDGAAQTLIHTGDDLEADGVAIGDTFVVLFDIKNNVGHTHNDIDAPSVVLPNDSIDSQHYIAGSIDEEHYAAGSVDATALKTTLPASSSRSSEGTTIVALAGGQYCFQIQSERTGAGSLSSSVFLGRANGSTTTWTTVDEVAYSFANHASLYSEGGSGTIFARCRYVATSGELHWIFGLYENGVLVSTWQASDHPTYGVGGYIEQPFVINQPWQNGTNFEVIAINPTLEQVERIQARTFIGLDGQPLTRDRLMNGDMPDPFAKERDFIEVFHDLYEIQESVEADWPDIPITVDLPRVHKGKIIADWRFPAGEKVKPVKAVIPKPDFVTCLQIREKE